MKSILTLYFDYYRTTKTPSKPPKKPKHRKNVACGKLAEWKMKIGVVFPRISRYIQTNLSQATSVLYFCFFLYVDTDVYEWKLVSLQNVYAKKIGKWEPNHLRALETASDFMIDGASLQPRKKGSCVQ
jgi:hypothetical protein